MKFAIFGCLYVLPLLAFSQTQHFQINIPSIVCHKKTGDGPDALYLLVTWKSKQGAARHQRMPFNGHYTISDTQHPDLNAAPATLDLGSIAAFDLGGDDYIDVFFSVMEQDDGTPAQYNDVGLQLMAIAAVPGKSLYTAVSGYVFKGILANVAKKYRLANPDDWVGACCYRVSRQGGGAVRIGFKQIHNPSSNGGYTQAASHFGPSERKPVEAAGSNEDFSFSGEGSNYDLRVTVTR